MNPMPIEYVSLGIGLMMGVVGCLVAEVFIIGLIQVRKMVFHAK